MKPNIILLLFSLMLVPRGRHSDNVHHNGNYEFKSTEDVWLYGKDGVIEIII